MSYVHMYSELQVEGVKADGNIGQAIWKSDWIELHTTGSVVPFSEGPATLSPNPLDQVSEP